jgi:S1-C subfamily serine protease
VVISEIVSSPLRHGDIILSINGKPVVCQSNLAAQLAQVGSGESVLLEILRDGAAQTVMVQLAPDGPPAVLEPALGPVRGITIAGLSNQNGVIVTDVQMGTAASDGGLKAGDIILEVDGHHVHTAEEFVKFMKQLNNLDASFNVRQADGEMSVFVIPSQP